MSRRTNTYLSDLAVRGEEDPSEGIRKATAVSGKQTAGLVHVCSQLEHLLHCGAHMSHHAKSSVCNSNVKTWLQSQSDR